MTSDSTDTVQPLDAAELFDDATYEVVAWRRAQLLRAGYAEEDAIALALRLDVDLHRALDLRARGCDGATALAILL